MNSISCTPDEKIVHLLGLFFMDHLNFVFFLLYQYTYMYRETLIILGSGYFAGPGKIAPRGYFAGPGKIVCRLFCRTRQNSYNIHMGYFAGPKT